MFKSLYALFLILSTGIVMASQAAPTKSEVELKVALTKSGYETLKSAFLANHDGESSERTDYYFDYFENSHYVLRDLEQPVKLRFMWDGENLKWQKQKVIKTGARSIFSIKTTEASEVEVAYEKAFFEAMNFYYQKLAAKDLYAMAIAASIQNTLTSKKLIEMSDKKYFPTHFNHKKRVKIKLKLDGDQFSVQVGETSNRGLVTYEIEAEIKKSTDMNKSIDRLNKWLQSQGFNSHHIDISVPVDPTEWSEKLLNEFFVFGIQNF